MDSGRKQSPWAHVRGARTRHSTCPRMVQCYRGVSVHGCVPLAFIYWYCARGIPVPPCRYACALLSLLCTGASSSSSPPPRAVPTADDASSSSSRNRSASRPLAWNPAAKSPERSELAGALDARADANSPSNAVRCGSAADCNRLTWLPLRKACLVSRCGKALECGAAW